MKTPTIKSFRYVSILLASIALVIYYLALQGDTVALGDPYYEALLAPNRALVPWTLTLLASGSVVVAKILQWLKR